MSVGLKEVIERFGSMALLTGTRIQLFWGEGALAYIISTSLPLDGTLNIRRYSNAYFIGIHLQILIMFVFILFWTKTLAVRRT